MSEAEVAPPGESLAIWAEVLYLANLLLAPGVAFIALLWLYWKHIGAAPPLARNHLRQTMNASLWAGMLLIIANGIVIAFGGYGKPETWLVVIIYFTCCHSALVLCGVFGLSRAMAGRECVYPLIGKSSERGAGA